VSRRSARARAALAAPLFALLALASGAPGRAVADAAAPRTVDRILATVDGDPILLSDLERLLGLGIVRREEGESDATLERRALDRMIENRLRLHELDRFGYEQAPLEEIDRRYQRIRDRFAGETEFRAELDRLGLDDTRLRLLVARQIAILAYVEERLGPRVFVGVEDIRKYFDEELKPELVKRGEPVPAIESVRESIRAVLRERRLNEEIDRWTRDLRAKADIEDFLEDKAKPLPPVVHRIEGSATP